MQCLAILLVLRWVLHAVYLPVFEGPDEPFHLGRARLVAGALTGSVDWDSALRGQRMDGELLDAVRRAPCGDDLRRAFSCPPIDGSRAEFNGLRQTEPVDPVVPTGEVENYQAHQPPLYYLVAGAALLPLQGATVETQLLGLRLLAVLFSSLGLWLLLPRLDPGWRCVFLAGLWLPGATESLIRVANDAPVFLWAAALLRWHLADRPRGLGGTACLLALGPLFKLTALPIAAFVVVDSFRRRGAIPALVLAASSSVFLPLQWLRGWAWGGTLEAEAGLASSDPVLVILWGLVHSAYTFVKTAIWLGGWSVFRPPDMLLVAGAVLALAWLPTLRVRRPPQRIFPHLAGAAVAVLGFLVFAVGKRRLFGIWGAVGGWYAWAWWPWLLLLFRDTLDIRSRGRALRLLMAVTFLWIVAINVSWWLTAHRIYGV